MTPLAVTSITNFILASEVFLLAGMLSARPMARYSAAWFWSRTMFFLGVGSLLGGLDHGFFEPAGQPRFLIQRGTWIALSAMTFCVLMTTATQFLPQRIQRTILVLATVQFLLSSIVALRVDSFLTVIVNYAPVLLLLLVLSVAKGFWSLTAGIVILLAASAIQATGIDTFSPLDHNGLYHLIAMIGVVFLYRGGLELSGERR